PCHDQLRGGGRGPERGVGDCGVDFGLVVGAGHCPARQRKATKCDKGRRRATTSAFCRLLSPVVASCRLLSLPVASSPILKSAPSLEILMSNSHRLSVVTVALLLRAACGDSATYDDPKRPAGVASVTIETAGPLGFASLGLSETLTATARDAAGDSFTATITWTSQDQAVARVSPTGVVTSDRKSVV